MSKFEVNEKSDGHSLSSESIASDVSRDKVYEATTEELTATTYIPEVPVIEEKPPVPLKGSQKVLLTLYTMLLVLKVIETLDLMCVIGFLLSKSYIEAGKVFVSSITCALNIGITVIGLATISCISLIAIELVISLCFLILIVQLLSSRTYSNNLNLNGWLLVTASLLIVSLFISKNIRKRNESFKNWLKIISKEVAFPRLRLIQQEQSIPRVIVTSDEAKLARV